MLQLPPFLTCDFEKETLSNLVKERFGDEFPNIINKRQIEFIFKYLKDLESKTILLESDYVDRDYLEDYARYYVKCFNRYGERCARIHFFKNEFNHFQFSNCLENNVVTFQEELNENYLGFIVIKPLPKTFIGKTCLKTYPGFNKDQTRRAIEVEYKVDLFGIALKVDSVAFQEQDKVLSACATTAIWSTLHAQHSNDNRKVNSCSEITLSAINYVIDSSNSFPIKGLTNKQILRALDVQGCRNHKIDIKNRIDFESFFNIVKVHIDSKMPIILGADVYKYADGNKLSKLGGHAVSILGYKEKEGEKAVYIHDDRLGPYAKAQLAEISSLLPDLEQPEGEEIEASWCVTLLDKDYDGNWCAPNEIMIPDSLIIATHPKIRISYDYIENTCVAIADELNRYSSLLADEEDIKAFNFKISLEELSKFRARILKRSGVSNKFSLLTKNSPRYLWTAEFFDSEDESLFEVVIDATDIPQGNAITAIVEYRPGALDFIKKCFEQIELEIVRASESTKNFFPTFIGALKRKNTGYMDYLDEKFGEPRAPKKIHKVEVRDNHLQEQSNVFRHFGKIDRTLEDDFSDLILDEDNSYKIWVISLDGALLIGEEIDGKGHPSITGFASARIAGELRRTSYGWEMNAKSGRYSSSYPNSNDLLDNARNKFLEIYNKEDPDNLIAKHYDPH